MKTDNKDPNVKIFIRNEELEKQLLAINDTAISLFRENSILQDKLSRRNMQIRKLKKRITELETFNQTFGDEREESIEKIKDKED